jgi:hypothetical protein
MVESRDWLIIEIADEIGLNCMGEDTEGGKDDDDDDGGDVAAPPAAAPPLFLRHLLSLMR